jgi:hypothetical protein
VFQEQLRTLVGPTFYLETPQADVWQHGQEIAFTGARDPGTGANFMSSVRSALSYTKAATFDTLSSPRWAPV